jgi:hypothetical protein
MRGKPLDVDVLREKIAAVRYDGPYLHSMKKGWMDIWKSEWLFLIDELSSYLDNNPNDALVANLVRKLSGGHNKLYITRAEQPWLIAWIDEDASICTKCGKRTHTVYVVDENEPLYHPRGLCEPCFQERSAVVDAEVA